MSGAAAITNGTSCKASAQIHMDQLNQLLAQMCDQIAKQHCQVSLASSKDEMEGMTVSRVLAVRRKVSFEEIEKGKVEDKAKAKCVRGPGKGKKAKLLESKDGMLATSLQAQQPCQ
ncbi:hypothetical protein H2248_010260 [Termitomyces sp. 'cryptogamus']|nr:hypothetical protein H2248_010260 [Termitomyces sp. 'cryptogamus']